MAPPRPDLLPLVRATRTVQILLTGPVNISEHSKVNLSAASAPSSAVPTRSAIGTQVATRRARLIDGLRATEE
jgi:hypothetical protein